MFGFGGCVGGRGATGFWWLIVWRRPHANAPVGVRGYLSDGVGDAASLATMSAAGTIAILVLDALLLPMLAFVWRLSARLTRIEAQVDAAANDHTRTETLLTETNQIVRQQLRPNSGDSIFDRVVSIGERVTAIEHRLGSGDHRLANHGERIAALEDKR